jgi:Tol biopolymer transport system component/DNA-binding winged helix-turn-helix (wHTH) protein
LRFRSFELDLTSGELHNDGHRVSLPPKAFEVLKALLERPGEVIPREELRARLWPGNTFVEFEDSLNHAVQKLRQALGDSAEHPRFIETLPRKGYRFIVAAGEPSTPASPGVVRRRRLWWCAGAGLVAVAAVSAWWLPDRPGRTPAAAPLPVPLTSYPGLASSPSFSPDGDRVAFDWDGPGQDNFDIYQKSIGEDQPVRLTSNPAPDNHPAWSPDGRHIAFSRDLSGGKAGVFLIPAGGGGERKLTEVWNELNEGRPVKGAGGKLAYVRGPRLAWHPGGRWLVVPDKKSAEEPLALFLVSVETGEKRRLTSPPGRISSDFHPAVSPDGRALAFARSPISGVSDLYLLDLSANLSPIGEPKRITFLGVCSAEPAWWPDGQSILFSSGASCHTVDLWRIARRRLARGFGAPERLPFGEAAARPAISRQGRVAYVQYLVTGHIWRLELGGGHRAENMAMNSTRLDHVPQYSPDGRRIAFASNRSGSHEIWLCDAGGSNTRKLTSFGGPYVANPVWSPDGRSIAFDARPDGASYIHTVSADGGKPVRLPGSRGEHGTPSWSRDGRWIYFFSARTGKNQVWKVPVDGREAVQITRQGGANAIESPDGEFVYYLRSFAELNNTELWRVPVRGGEEIRIIESVSPQFFAVIERGIYFLSGWQNPSVRCFNFATRKIETVGSIEGEVAFGLSVSADGRRLLYSAYGPRQGVLMQVENYRP